MLALLSIVAPVFLLIALGYGLGRIKLFAPEQVRGFGRFVMLVALPALVFNALSTASMTKVFRPDYLLVYALASVLAFAVGYVWFRYATGADGAVSAARALGMGASNTAFVGLPVLSQVFGAAAAGPIALNMLVENIVVLPLVMICIEAGRQGHGPLLPKLAAAGRGLLRNPLLIAIVAGGLLSVSGLGLPMPVMKAVRLLAGASAPLALVTIGASLAGVSLSGLRGAIGAIALGKLVLHPALVLAIMLVVPVGDPLFHTAIILLAAMPMVSIFPLMAEPAGDGKTCAAALLVTTAASFFTLIAVMAMLGVTMTAG